MTSVDTSVLYATDFLQEKYYGSTKVGNHESVENTIPFIVLVVQFVENVVIVFFPSKLELIFGGKSVP